MLNVFSFQDVTVSLDNFARVKRREKATLLTSDSRSVLSSFSTDCRRSTSEDAVR